MKRFPFALFVAWKFMLRGSSNGTFSSMTVFAWIAIAMGVTAMGCLLSVMYGFESSLHRRVLKAYPHIMVRPKVGGKTVSGFDHWTRQFKALGETKRVVPFMETEMIVQSDMRTLGAVIWGLPSDALKDLGPDVTSGTLPTAKSSLPEILLGPELAERLGVSIGGKVKLLSPLTTGGISAPQFRTFTVSGIYTSGHYDFDQQYIFMLLRDCQHLTKMKEVISGWHIWAKSLDEVDSVERDLRKILPTSLEAQSWKIFNRALFQSLKLEQYSMFAILCFAVLIAVMNIVITLIMHVTQKRIHIGILRSMGLSELMVKRIFMIEGMLMGGVGLVIGAVCTAGFLIVMKYFAPFELPEIYYDRSIPVEVRPLSILLIYLVAIFLILIGTLYPAAKAAKLDPLEAIRR